MQPIQWRGLSKFDKAVMVFLSAAAVVSFIIPLLDSIFLRRLGNFLNVRPIINWLVNQNGSLIVGGLFLAALAVFILWKRHQMISNKGLWFSVGCPQCMEQELVRVSRARRDRWYGLLGIPAYRYACRNCTWRGLRIGRRLLYPEIVPVGASASELEGEADDEAMLVAEGIPSAYEELELDGEAGWAERHDFGLDLELDPAETDADWAPEESESDETVWVDESPETSLSSDETLTGETLEETSNNHRLPESDHETDEFEWLWRRLQDKD